MMRDEINKALEVLRAGGTILYPTDTVWGIGCDATNAQAVSKVYAIKQRNDTRAMLVLLDSEARLQQYVNEVPEVAYQLIEVADKPLTIVYPGARNLASNLVSADGSIGIRIVSEAFCSQLLQKFKKPIVSTSANISGTPTPSVFRQIDPVIIRSVDYTVNYRRDDEQAATPSSVIKLGTGGEIEIIRK